MTYARLPIKMKILPNKMLMELTSSLKKMLTFQKITFAFQRFRPLTIYQFGMEIYLKKGVITFNNSLWLNQNLIQLQLPIFSTNKLCKTKIISITLLGTKRKSEKFMQIGLILTGAKEIGKCFHYITLVRSTMDS